MGDTLSDAAEALGRCYAARGYLVVGSNRRLPTGHILRNVDIDGAPCEMPLRVVAETTREDCQAQLDLWGNGYQVHRSWSYFYRVESD